MASLAVFFVFLLAHSAPTFGDASWKHLARRNTLSNSAANVDLHNLQPQNFSKSDDPGIREKHERVLGVDFDIDDLVREADNAEQGEEEDALVEGEDNSDARDGEDKLKDSRRGSGANAEKSRRGSGANPEKSRRGSGTNSDKSRRESGANPEEAEVVDEAALEEDIKKKLEALKPPEATPGKNATDGDEEGEFDRGKDSGGEEKDKAIPDEDENDLEHSKDPEDIPYVDDVEGGDGYKDVKDDDEENERAEPGDLYDGEGGGENEGEDGGDNVDDEDGEVLERDGEDAEQSRRQNSTEGDGTHKYAYQHKEKDKGGEEKDGERKSEEMLTLPPLDGVHDSLLAFAEMLLSNDTIIAGGQHLELLEKFSRVVDELNTFGTDLSSSADALSNVTGAMTELKSRVHSLKTQMHSEVKVDYNSGRQIIAKDDDGSAELGEVDGVVEGVDSAANDHDDEKSNKNENPDELVENVLKKSNDPALIREDIVVLKDLALLLIFSWVGGSIALALHWPVFVGFIVAGITVGPAGLGFVQNSSVIGSLAQIGVAMILFIHGLSFDSDIVARFKKTSAWVLSVQVLSAPVLLFIFAKIAALEMTAAEILLLGLSISICSSTAAVDVSERLEGTAPYEVLCALMIAQDLFMGVLLCIPSAMSLGFSGIFLIVKRLVYVAFVAAVSRYTMNSVIPRFSKMFASQTSHLQLFMLSTVGFCLMAGAFTKVIGLSMELGAFFAGLTLSKTPSAEEARNHCDYVKHLFSPVLFSSVGMLISPAFIISHFPIIVSLCALVIFAKLALALSTMRLVLNFNPAVSWLTSGPLAQVGEFSMLLAGKGYALGFITRHNYLIFITISVTSLIAMPVLQRVVHWRYASKVLTESRKERAHRNGHTTHPLLRIGSDEERSSLLSKHEV